MVSLGYQKKYKIFFNLPRGDQISVVGTLAALAGILTGLANQRDPDGAEERNPLCILELKHLTVKVL
jgi:hypothetical protein